MQAVEIDWPDALGETEISVLVEPKLQVAERATRFGPKV